MLKHESMFSFSDSNIEDTFQIGVSNNNNIIQVYCNRTPKLYTIASYTGYGSSGNWNHVAVTFNNSSATLKTYFNGSLTNTYNRTTSPPTTHTTAGRDMYFYMDRVKIGSNRNENVKYRGWISILGVYDEELTSTDISSLYNNNEICYHPSTNILTDYGYITRKSNIYEKIKLILIKYYQNKY